jgi:hypothetical protein
MKSNVFLPKKDAQRLFSTTLLKKDAERFFLKEDVKFHCFKLFN